MAAHPTGHAGSVETRGGGGEQDAKSMCETQATVVRATQMRLRNRPQGRREHTGPEEVMMFILTRLPLPSTGICQTADAA